MRPIRAFFLRLRLERPRVFITRVVNNRRVL
jgi:hypothetical protein